MKFGQWCYSFKFLEGIKLHWLFHAGFGEVRFLFDANSWFFAILKWFRDGFPLFKLIFFFLKLKRILTKIDISGVNCICINLTPIVGRFDMWVTTKTNRPSFCLILNFLMYCWSVQCILSRLHGRKDKSAFCWMKHHWTWLLSDIVAWDSFKLGTPYLF